MRYALLDWDNTLRQDYALFSWISYLVSHYFISGDVQYHINESIDRYKNGIITHDDFAKQAAEIYACFIKNHRVSNISKHLAQYKALDESHLFPFTRGLFNVLHKNDIKPIIISGSLRIIIESYSLQFNLFKIYAFEPEENCGIYTGKVLCNYGYNKDKLVNLILEEFGANPILAFGDTESDLPLLKVAKYGFLISENMKKIQTDAKLYSLSADADENTVIELVNTVIENLE